MNKLPLTLGSLFDGIGGFCLAGQLAGITPVWASEIEPFPIRVTEKRFPEVQQLGDVHAIDGGEIPSVDIVTFGSPCQNLSIAGKRAGLGGEQSSLFFEAVRIIREMREKTHGQYPRWAVWENVPGALSSNNGRDFRSVLESLAQIADPQADVPMPAEGKWQGAGEIVGDHYSLAWRILDASKGWGVAQRRRRIFAVLDLNGTCAGQVLFESEGLSGYTPPGRETRQGTASCAEKSAGETGLCLNDQGGCRMDVTHEMTSTLRAEAHHPPCVLNASGFCTEHSANSRGVGYADEESPTLRAGVVPGVAIEFNPSDSRIKVKEDGICQTLTARMGTGGNNVPLTMKIRSGCEGGGKGPLIQTNMSATLATNNDQTLFEPVVYGISADKSNAMLSDNPHSGIYEAKTSRTLDCNGGNPVCAQGGMAVVSPMLASGKDQCGTLTARASSQKSFLGNQEAFSGDYYVIEPRTDSVAEPSYCIQGSIIGRKEENGPQGAGINEELAFTLNTIDRPAVAYGLDRASYNQGQNAKFDFSLAAEQQPTMTAKGPGAVCCTTGSYMLTTEEVSPTLMARDWKDPSCVCTEYIVRRLTPDECCRLQGYPDGWCHHLESESPGAEEIERWRKVFALWDGIQGKTRPRTDNQIIKWLQHPNSDAAEYKAYGNSVAVPCVFFVLAGIVWAAGREETE